MELTTITPSTIDHVVKSLVHRVPCVDLALHSTVSAGVDGLLTSPDLMEELRRAGGTVHDETDVEKNANEVWKTLFVHRTPLSESCRRVLTLLNKLGFRDHIHTRNLAAIRESVRGMPDGAWRAHVLKMANLQRGVRAVDVEGAAPPDEEEEGFFGAVVGGLGEEEGYPPDVAEAIESCAAQQTRQRLHHVRFHVHAGSGNNKEALAAAARAAAARGVPLWVVVDARHAAVPAALLECRVIPCCRYLSRY